MSNIEENYRIAWLFPSLEFGNYWQPIFREITRIYKHTCVFTGNWPGFLDGYEGSFFIRVVGKTFSVDHELNKENYTTVYINASPKIIFYLLNFRPQVIFASGFSIWTVLSVLLKPFKRWKIVIAYDGSSPTIDYINSPFRLRIRRLISGFSDAFITNSHAGKHYLIDTLGIEAKKVFRRPYQIADVSVLLGNLNLSQSDNILTQSLKSNSGTRFLYVGQVRHRKGIHLLLKACVLLKKQGLDFSLWIVGDGSQRSELEAFCQSEGLTDCVQWFGYQRYNDLGIFFKDAHVFVLPSLEDTWGMVVLEAMAFAKPVLCSRWAGASEMIKPEKNGFIFDPYEPKELADKMQKLCQNWELISEMGQQSQQIMSEHTPQVVAQFLAEVVEFVMKE
jgi:glycosyltransferase involved in cell wall biosynthesis